MKSLAQLSCWPLLPASSALQAGAIHTNGWQEVISCREGGVQVPAEEGDQLPVLVEREAPPVLVQTHPDNIVPV